MSTATRTIQVISDISDVSYNEMFGIMSGVAKAISEEPPIFAPLAAVKELSIIHGAFLTRLLAKSYISPAVLFTNVAPHPTYTSDVIGKLKGRDILVIGSNNGTFDWLAKDFGFEYLAEITVRRPYVVDGKLIYTPGSNPPEKYDATFAKKSDYLTFSAHVIYGSIAVALAYDIDYRKFGEDRDMDFIIPLEISNGEVVHIDNYGNAKIYGSLPFSPGTKLNIFRDDQKIAEAEYIDDRMMSHTTNSFVIYPSTSLPDMVDLALVRGNACKKLDLQLEDVLMFHA